MADRRTTGSGNARTGRDKTPGDRPNRAESGHGKSDHGNPGRGKPDQGRPRRVQPRRTPVDPARFVAWQLLRAVDENDAYANLVLPGLLAERRLSGRDAGLATEIGYGTLRAQGTLDAVLAQCVDRSMDTVQPGVRDVLRLGAYQALRTRIPAHAAVATSVDLAHATQNGRAGGFINAVLRKVTAHDWEGWTEKLTADVSPITALALRTSHPEWIVEAFVDALDGDLTEAGRALQADDERPQTHLVAWPGRSTREELLAEGEGVPGPYSPFAVRLAAGEPAAMAAVRERRAGVQDEGSQLCALAFAAAPIEGRDELWLDACAGPGGKAALLTALAVERGAVLRANERRAHRADLVRRVTSAWGVEVTVSDARELPRPDGGYDRVLVDAPCTGLGALRRRPEARWRRRPEDVTALVEIQRDLLAAALRLTRPGGVVAYVTCSPHLAETRDVVAGQNLIDARPLFPGVPDLGDGPTVQLWPHRHGTDAMFCAIIRR